MRENPQLVKELKDLLLEYFDHHKSASVHSFSKKCGVSSSTVRRLLNGDTKMEPMAPTVLGIISALSGEANVSKLIGKYSGEIGIKLKQSYSNVLPQTEYVPELTQVLSDRVAYIVYKLASNVSGAKIEHIVELVGVPALQTVNDLKEQELIFEENGRLYSSKRSFLLPLWLIKKHVPELLRFTHYGSKYVDSSCFYSISESINANAYEEIRQILVGAVKQIRQVLKSENSYGEIPFFFTSALDTMEVSHENSE